MKKSKKAYTSKVAAGNYSRIQEFLRSGLSCDRVLYSNKTAMSCRCSLSQTLKRYGIRNVRVIKSGEYIILLRVDG